MLQLLKAACLEPMLCNKRSHPMRSPHTKTKSSPRSPQLQKSPRTATKTQRRHKKMNKIYNFIFKKFIKEKKKQPPLNCWNTHSQSSALSAGSSEGKQDCPTHTAFPLMPQSKHVLSGTLLVLKVCLIPIHKSCGQPAS